MADESDPKIVDRLKKMPPYGDDEPVETPEEQEETPGTPETPEEVEPSKEEKTKERTTKQFDKLKESNNNLKEALEIEKKKNILDSLQPTPVPTPEPPQWPQAPITNVVPNKENYPGVSQKQIEETFKGLVDENGYVDTGLLIGELKDLREKNKSAEERAKVAEQETQKVSKKFDDFERNAIMVKVHEKFPTLDPNNDNFDEKLWKYVRNEVVDQWMTGKQTDVMAAAQEGMNVLHPVDMKKAEKEQVEKAEIAKKNINALNSSKTLQRETYSDHDALVKATQLGRKGALAERLSKAGF
jgi:hypothetical protein